MTPSEHAPRPRALRLVCRAAPPRAPAPPLGVRAFTDDPDADLAVLLDVDPDTPARAQVDDACAQIPPAAELPAGRTVIVLAQRASGGGLLGRLFGARARGAIPIAVRATALLARGYTQIGAHPSSEGGADLVWGVTPPS